MKSSRFSQEQIIGILKQGQDQPQKHELSSSVE